MVLVYRLPLNDQPQRTAGHAPGVLVPKPNILFLSGFLTPFVPHTLCQEATLEETLEADISLISSHVSEEESSGEASCVIFLDCDGVICNSRTMRRDYDEARTPTLATLGMP